MQYKRILFAYDGSQLGDEMLRDVADIALPSQAELTLLHVLGTLRDALLHVTPVGEWMAQSPGMVAIAEHGVAQERTRVASKMGEASERLKAAGIASVSMRIESGPPALTIVQVARQEGTDLILTASHSSGHGSGSIGSVADYLVRHAPCAVLVRPSQRVSAAAS